jgi:hypothetical protein
MSVQYSTGLRAHISVTGSKKNALDDGFLYYFSGPVPLDADTAIDGTSVALAKFSVGGDGSTGLTFESDASDGVLKKTQAEAWKSTASATGTATFFRFCEASDEGTATSTTAKRIQGTLGTTMASDAQLRTTSLAASDQLEVTKFQDY